MKQFENDTPSNLFVALTWPDHPSIKAISENDLGENVTMVPCKIRKHSHATGLDEILDLILSHNANNPNDLYTHMFCAETDAMACQKNWLDWFHEQFKKVENCGMAGFFWHEGQNHYNINPSGTLYSVEMLARYHKECRENNEGMFWHPNGNRHDTESGMDPSIKDVAGVFSETRGIKNANPKQVEEIKQGVPQAAWFEPGAWLYYRSLGEYEHVRVPCDHKYTKFGPVSSPEGTYYGGVNDTKYLHFWGGTRAYDFLKHPVNDGFVSGGAPYWLEREDTIWKNNVPEKYRQIMPKVYKEMEFNTKLQSNLPGAVEKMKKMGLL
jgi:hypothetical protein